MKSTFLRWFCLLLPLLALPATAKGIEALDIDFGEGWELGYVAEDRQTGVFINEYVPIGQTVENWSNLLTFQGFPVRVKPHRITLRSYVDLLEKRMRARCMNTMWSVLWEKNDRVIYRWHISRCPGQDDQAEIAAFIAGDTTMFRVAYTKKTSTGMGAADRNWWERVLLAAEVVQTR